MPGSREPAHVGVGLGDDHVGDQDADPGDRDDQVPGAAKGLHHHLDPGCEFLNSSGVLVDQVQVHPGQERVVFGEPAGQGLDELRGFRPQPPFARSASATGSCRR